MNCSNCSASDIDGTISSDHFETPELPERLWTDYAEITFLVLMLLVGAPLNILAICRSFIPPVQPKTSVSGGRDRFGGAAVRIALLNPSRSTGSLRTSRTLSQFKTLQVHLSVANLMIICAYGLSQICWLITIQWHGGDIGCRLVKFLHTFCFYATSNMVAMIAIDRLCVTIYVDRQSLRSRAICCLRGAIVAAWLLAFCSSLPQAFFWRAYAPFPENPTWYQCVTLWVAQRHRLALTAENYPAKSHNDGGDQDLSGALNVSVSTVHDNTFHEDLYGGVHLALVFWFPAAIVLSSYGVIVAKFQTKIRQTNRETSRRRQCKRENEAVYLRQAIASLHKVNSQSVTEDSVTVTQETTITSVRYENSEITEQSVKLLGLPIFIHSTQAAAIRRRSRGDLAITTLTRAKRTTLRKTMWILFAYVLCWSPYNILELWRYFDTTFENSYLEFLSNLIVLNAVLNPLIYSV